MVEYLLMLSIIISGIALLSFLILYKFKKFEIKTYDGCILIDDNMLLFLLYVCPLLNVFVCYITICIYLLMLLIKFLFYIFNKKKD